MPRKAKEERIVFDWMRGASERSRQSWERRWEQAFFEGGKLGKKGEAYIESKYGPLIGGGPGIEEGPDWPDDWHDFYDSEEETP